MPTRGKKEKKLLIASSISAAAVILLLLLTTIAGIWSPPFQGAQAITYRGVTREFYLNNLDNPKINETLAGIPADMYNIPEITVKKGDTVVIHFFNVEPKKDDRHSFTIFNGPYATNVVLDGGGNQNRTITFRANQTGIFQYVCTFHMPSMRGQLVVAPPTLDEFRAQEYQHERE